MNRVQKFTQAYSQTPWRKQLQGIGMFLALLVFGSLIAIIYLNVTARAATIGREIQDLQVDIQQIERDIADRQSQLAEITSYDSWEQRAEDMDFVEVTPGEALYVVVPGYPGKGPANLAPPPITAVEVHPVISPDYTQSLLDWVKEQFYLPNVPDGSEQP